MEAAERVHYDRFNILVSTPNFQPIRTYPVADNTVVRFELTLVSDQADHAHRSTFRRTILVFRSNGGAVTMQTGVLTDQTIKSHQNLEIQIVTRLASIQVQVRNADNTPTRWVGYADRTDVRM
jgi:hypothetical protein